MRVTDVRIRKTNGETGNLKAYAGIVIDNALAIHDIKIIDGKEGLFITFPSRMDKEGKYRDIIHPINTEARNVIQMAIIEQYTLED